MNDAKRPSYGLEDPIGDVALAKGALTLGRIGGTALLRQVVRRRSAARFRTPTGPRLPAEPARVVPRIHQWHQDKHIIGTNNYDPRRGRNILTADAQSLANEFAGRGRQVGKIPVGQPGSKESFRHGRQDNRHLQEQGRLDNGADHTWDDSLQKRWSAYCSLLSDRLVKMRYLQDMPYSVCVSAKGALGGQTPESLRAFSFAIDMVTWKILLRAHFDSTPSEDDLDEISCAETEIMADFLFVVVETITTDVEVAPVGQPMAFLPDGVAYLRAGEPGTVCS